MDQLTAMRVFVKVVETGSFTRAAETLTMPKATVTTFVQSLEGHLKTRLLNRTTRLVNVTTDGAMYYERAVRILADVDELDATLANTHARPTGRLRVEMAGVLSDTIVLPAIADFQERYPDIQLDVGISDRTVDYLAENVDCALRAGTPRELSMISRMVGEVAFINCASPKYLQKFGVPSRIEDVRSGKHRLIGYIHSRTGKPFSFQAKSGVDEFEFAPDFVLATSDTRSSLVAAIEGLGIFQAPEMLVGNALQEGLLVPILHEWKRTPMPLFVVYPPNRHLSNKVRVFVDWLVRLLAERKPYSINLEHSG